MIRNYCKEDDIVLDIDADDYLLGRQYLNVLNAVYQSGDYWLVYASYWMQRSENMAHG